MPDLLKVARQLEHWGAEGITVHPRPDERHVKYSDLQPLKDLVQTEFNVEGYPDERFMVAVLAVRPNQCTLVPDPPGALTSDGGWQTKREAALLKPVVSRLQDAGIRVSLFVDPDPDMVFGAAEVGADRVELYTGTFALEYTVQAEQAIVPHILAAEAAAQAGLGLNAGHDLNLDNLRFYRSRLPNLAEVSIGHAIVCDALYYGLQNTVQMYLHCLRDSYEPSV